MNVENIHTTRDAILAAGPAHFNMCVWSENEDGDWAPAAAVIHHDCGTVACIGGWAEALAKPESPQVDNLGGDTAADFLGIDEETAALLFLPYGIPDWDAITPQDAADVLDLMVETGVVDWHRVMTRNHPELMLDAIEPE